MKTYIALFRGINVGGKNTLPMKELVAVLENVGAQSVRTYIQSGNAVFASRARDTAQLAQQISLAIKQRRGFAPHVMLLEMEALEKTLRQNPFPATVSEPQTLHAGFLDSVPGQPDLSKLESLKAESEQFQLIEGVFYLHAPEGIGRSKLASQAEKCLGVPMTMRNWRTVCQLRDLASGLV